MIAHRLTTVKDCDVIYQFDHAPILAKSDYDTLMAESLFRSAAGA